jgi:hypothetical protein
MLKFALAAIPLKRAVEIGLRKIPLAVHRPRDTLKFVSIVGLCTSNGPSCVRTKGPFVVGGSEIESGLSPIGRSTCRAGPQCNNARDIVARLLDMCGSHG